MKKRSDWVQQLLRRVRPWFERPALAALRRGVRYVQARLHGREFGQMRQLATRPELAPLLARNPRFAYRHLTSYAAAGFSRAMRAAALLHHYQQLATTAAPGFVARLAAGPLPLWQQPAGEHTYRIGLGLPLKAEFEGELSLFFYQDALLLQMLTGVLVPGRLVGVPAVASVLLISQVQGTLQPVALRQAGKLLHESTPATLLVHAAYGLAAALGATHVAGVGTRDQLGRGEQLHFDYDAFWAQLRGQRLPTGFYLLDPAAPERPLADIKAKYRPRTVRKRAFKHGLRQAAAAVARQQLAQPGL